MDTLSELRTRVHRLLQWAPTASAEATASLTAAINQAVQDVYLADPKHFNTESFRFFTEPVVDPISSADTISLADDGAGYIDPWVFIRDLAPGTLGAANLWATDGSLTGRTLEITDDEGYVHHRVIRQVWTASAPGKGGASSQHVSLVEPWHTQSQTSFTWKIKAIEYPIPSRFQAIAGIRGLPLGSNATRTSPLEFVPRNQGWALEAAGLDPFGTGSQRLAYAVGRRGLERPTYTPTVSLGGQGTWLGPHPPGTYEFCFTHSFGVWDPRAGLPGPRRSVSPTSTSQGAGVYRRPEPYMESGPSPVSAQATTDGTNSIIIGLPDKFFELGFADPNTLRKGYAGVNTCIWVRCVSLASYSSGHPGSTARPSGYNASTPAVNIQGPHGWRLLDTVSADTAEYTWTGATLPEDSRKLPAASEHLTLRVLQEFQAPEMQMLVEGPTLPAALVDDTEALRLPPALMAHIVARAAMIWCPLDNPTMYTRAADEFDRTGRILREGIGSDIPSGQPVTRNAPWRRR